MINVMHSVSKAMNQVERSLDPQLWHACAGGLAQLPPQNSKVYYFPQGHAEHSNNKNINFNGFSRIPSLIPCKVSSINYLADLESDEVYARIRLLPLNKECDVSSDDDVSVFKNDYDNDEKEKTNNSFAKTLTQSDANNGGGFSVPRYCAETIFPRLDYSAEPPVQTISAKDVHGEIWKFRHIYRGTPRRHLLTTGWSSFVNRKKLMAGDSIVFLRAENGELRVGIRRAKRGIGEGAFGWNSGISNFGNRNMCEKGSEGSECVVEAMNLAVGGRPFEVVYYPRAGAPEFVVGVRAVRDAMRVRWSSGMRFKMPFETEDSSRISWFMGTVSGVRVDDPIRWPNSPWRVLQVAWDEPDLLQNVKRVNPWQVELVSNMPSTTLFPFSPPPKKRQRFLPQPSSEFPLFGHLPFLTNPLSPISPLSCCFPSDNISALGVQGARHLARFDLSPSDLSNFKKPQPFDFELLDYANALSRPLKPNGDFTTNQEVRKNGDASAPKFLLFGQPILTANQIARSHSESRQLGEETV